MTSPNGLNDRWKLLMDTWGKRCNKIIFFSQKFDPGKIIKNVEIKVKLFFVVRFRFGVKSCFKGINILNNNSPDREQNF